MSDKCRNCGKPVVDLHPDIKRYYAEGYCADCVIMTVRSVKDEIEQEGEMSEKYSTNWMIDELEDHLKRRTSLSKEETNAIVAQLQAADKLCEDIKHDIECSLDVDRICTLVRKAIAEYRGKK